MKAKPSSRREQRRGPRRETDPAAGDIRLALGGADDREAARTLAYAVRDFAAAGDGATMPTLQQGLGAAVETVRARSDNWRRTIADGRFSLVAQPIVSLADREIHHHEVLARFPRGQQPFDTVRFAEEVGLIEEFDLAVCVKALAALEATPGLALAVNLSGRSVQNAGFCETLRSLLRANRSRLGRLMFELTESHAVEQFEETAAFLGWLRSEGCSICLDDFGAGAATYHYLRHFNFDFVKIDGPFLRSAASHPRDRVLVRSICALCHELDIGVIGEMIEDQTALDAAVALGIEYGQGRLFGAPSPLL
jgi:EAL domain-containing protein (putative c-di-GMP-specific phosphodiesterase class I)